jgi:hypothetical protein
VVRAGEWEASGASARLVSGQAVVDRVEVRAVGLDADVHVTADAGEFAAPGIGDDVDAKR